MMHTKRVLVFVVLLLIVLTTLICVESLVHGRGRAKSVKDHEVLNVKSQHKHSLPSIPKLIIRTGEPEQKDLHPDVADRKNRPRQSRLHHPVLFRPAMPVVFVC